MSGLHFTLWGWNATYDARNRAVSMADTQEQAEGKNRQTVYDAHGNVVGTVDAKGQSASSAFDARDRRTSETSKAQEFTTMNKKQLFAFFKKQPSPVLIEYLEAAYEAMSTDQRNEAFGAALRRAEPLRVDGKALLKRVKGFQRDSLAGKYYAPFDINSKNFMHVPEETKAWFERLGDLLTESGRLSRQGDHPQAVACFRILYELVEAMESGEEIVFADEYGTWMIPVDERKIQAAHLASLAATTTPEEYAAATIPLIRRDSVESFSKKTYSASLRAADKAQKACLKAEIQRLRVRTGPR